MNTNDHKAKERIIGLFLVFLICLFFLTWVEAAERHWQGDIRYSTDNCQQFDGLIDQVAKEISPYAVTVSRGTNPHIEISCAESNPFGHSNRRGMTTSYYRQSTQEMVKAETWINPDQSNHLKTVRHEFVHALGFKGHTLSNTLMRSGLILEVQHFDVETLKSLMDRYDKDFTVVDEKGDRYTPRIYWQGQWWWSIERLNGSRWEVESFGQVKHSEP